MPFQKGNKDAAYSEEKIREFAKLYIEHLEKGYSKESFWPCTYTTVEDRIEKEPIVFQTEKELIQQAFRKGMHWWETQGIENIVNREEMSKDKDGNITVVKTSLNSAAWIFNVKNRFPNVFKDRQEIDQNITEIQVIRPKSPKDQLKEPDES